MKKATIILIFLAVGVGIVLMWTIFYSNQAQEWKIKREIAKAGYCEFSSDCQIVAAQCPFNCYAYVNKNEAARIEALIGGYESHCVYSCIEPKEAVCANNICQRECFGSQCKEQTSWKRKIMRFVPF